MNNIMELYFKDAEMCKDIAFLTCMEMRVKGHKSIISTGFNFKLMVPDNPMIDFISVSIPPDANRNISEKELNAGDLEKVDWIVYETALFKNDEIIYSDKDGFYEDGIARFWSLNELAEEISRVKKLIEDNK